MIVTRTPFRIAFFGAETIQIKNCADRSGEVLAATINKYCHISLKKLPGFFDHKHRVQYSKTELVQTISQIQHPAVRETMKSLELNEIGYDIQHSGDLPARSGIGDEAAFVVGLYNAFTTELEQKSTKKELADKSIRLQRNILKENIATMDHITSSFGGLNKINFELDGKYSVEPVKISFDRLNLFNNHLLLFYSGRKNNLTHKIESQKEKNFAEQQKLKVMKPVIQRALSILMDEQSDIKEFGFLMNEAWNYNNLYGLASYSETIQNIYCRAKNTGAIGGKTLGEVDGSFILFFASPTYHEHIIKELDDLVHVPFRFENKGSHVLGMP